MPGDDGDGFMLEDTDRLPWLEPAESLDDIQAVPVQKVVALVVLGLVLLGLIIGGGWWLRSRSAEPAAGGDAALITPPSANYKIPADAAAAKKYDVDGKAFAGEGDAAFEASAGANSAGRIDPSKAPEVPMTENARAEPPKPAPAKSAPPKAGAPPVAVPTPAPTPAVSLGGARIQIGAYNSKAIAEEAYKRLVKRFDDLSGVNHAVEPVPGKTLYRLRLGAADKVAAATLCGRLRVAGENCFVVP